MPFECFLWIVLILIKGFCTSFQQGFEHICLILLPVMRKLKVTELNRLDVEQFKASEKTPLAVVLDDVRSMHNVGSVFRTADAFRAELVCLCGITSCPPHAEIHKTALGAEDSVEWKHYGSAMEAVQELHAAGFEVYALEQVEGSVSLNDFVPENGKKYAIVLGNEVKGVAQEVVDACDGALEIPQFGTKHSLNVSVSGGIAIWHFAKSLLGL